MFNFLPTPSRSFVASLLRMTASEPSALPPLLGHGRSPVVGLEEGHVVLLRQRLQETGHRLRRAVLPPEGLLVRLQKRQKGLVAQLPVQEGQKVRALVVVQPRPDDELSLQCTRVEEPVGMRYETLFG